MRNEYLDDIFFTLEWLGIEPDEGPGSVSEFSSQYSQKFRIEEYAQLLRQIEKQAAVFSCSCSRSEVCKRTGSNIYDGFCRSRTPKGSLNRRLDTSKIEDTSWTSSLPYPILWKKDYTPSYHLASTGDDQVFEIDLIIRGMDLQYASGLHSYISSILEKNEAKSPSYFHHDLIKDSEGNKISKSTGVSNWQKSRSERSRIYALASQYFAGPKKIDDISGLEGLFDPLLMKEIK